MQSIKVKRSRLLFGFIFAIVAAGIGIYGCGSGSSETLGSAVVTTSTSTTSATIPITGVAADPIVAGQVVVSSPTPPLAGAIILVSGTGGLYDGQFTVVSATATSFTIAVPGGFTTTAAGAWQPAGGLIGAPCGTTVTAGSGAAITLPSMDRVPSRVTGVAPLAVHFNAFNPPSTLYTPGIVANATPVIGSTTPSPFHDLEYRWTFDSDPASTNPSSGNWGDKATGSSGTGANTSRNTARGPVAAHVFEAAGTYIVNLTVTDGTNTVSNSCLRIAVQDPEVVYASTTTVKNTICISSTGIPVGGAGGCPANADGQQIADFCVAVNTYKGTGKRVLFRRGEVFGCAGGATISNNGPWTIGAYPVAGAGLARVVSTQAAGVGVSVLGVGAGTGVFPADGRIMDLEITSTSAVGTKPTAIKGIGNMDQLTLLNLNIHDVGDGPQFLVDFVEAAGNNHLWDQLSIVDTTVKTITGGAGTHGLFIFASRMAILGNLIDDTFLGEHLARLDYHNGTIINHNTLRNGAAGKETLAIRGLQQNPAGAGYAPNVAPAPSPSQNIVISDNDFTLDTPEGVKLGTSSAATVQVAIQNVISERNLYRGSAALACGGGLCAQNALLTSANGHTIRNEIVRWDNFLFYTFVDVQAASAGGTLAGTNVNIYNNTAFSANNSNGGVVSFAQLEAATSVANVKNNLIYVPSSTSTTFPVFCVGGGGSCAGFGVTQSNNSTGSFAGGTNDIKLRSPDFTVTTPVALADFKPKSTSYAILPGAGTAVPVWSDFFLVQRPPHHLGAVLP